jgi:ParB family chromosome partitioning protein
MTTQTAAKFKEEHPAETGVVLIPLNKLKKSSDNARKTARPKAEIEALAASIHAKGILQNLVVAPERDATGVTTGYFLVTIGEGRRLAQCLRVKRKQIPETEPIRCVIDTDNNALEISLDENVTRSAMSVMDEVEAFAALADGGMFVDDIARRFGCTIRLVEQRLALARLSPKIRTAYRKGDINLDVARAFAINDDHTVQERVFKQFAKPITHAASVRTALTAGRVSAQDKLALFVGVEAYEAAGGRITKDLFETDTIFFDDGDLLHTLASEKLEGLRAKLTEEGWGWVDVQLLGHGHIEGCAHERLHATQRKLKPGERKAIAALQQRLHELDAKLAENEDDDALWTAREAVEAELDALVESTKRYDPRLMSHAGAVVSVDREGRAIITRGLIKRSEAKLIAKLRTSDAGAAEGEDTSSRSEGTTEGPRLPKSLVEQLTRTRTRALRAALAGHPHTALALTVYVLVRQSKHRSSAPGIALAPRPVGFEDDDTFQRARLGLGEELDDDEFGLLSALLDRSPDDLLRIHAHFLAETLDFTHPYALPEHKRLQRVGDCLAAALDLDMKNHWDVSEEFFATVPKAFTLDAMRSAPSIAALGPKAREKKLAGLGKMKKPELARAAAKALQKTGWLPELLITPDRAGTFALTDNGVAVVGSNPASAHAA